MIWATKGRKNKTAFGTALLLPPLLVLLALTAATPSPATTTLSQTRVWDFSLENPHHDRAVGDLSQRIRPENRSARLETASGSPLATRGLEFATKQSAREALTGPLGTAANRFFRDAAKNAQNFRIFELAGGGRRFEFFSPARNPGYGKLYVQEVDSLGAIIREFKNTLGPDGLIETKWLHGGP